MLRSKASASPAGAFCCQGGPLAYADGEAPKLVPVSARALVIPGVMTLQTLADVRKLIGHLPADFRERSTWRSVEAQVSAAATGAEGDSLPEPRYVTDFPIVADGHALVKAFVSINDPKVQRRVVNLVEEIARKFE